MIINKNCLVSVIIPVYNREHLILNSIESVLSQSYQNIELIIIDDASTDGTEFAVRGVDDGRVKYYKQNNNKGPSAARNLGVQKANGELIAFLDSDDEWYLNKIEKQVNIFAELDDDFAAVFCNYETIDFKTKEKLGERIIKVDVCENFRSGSQFETPSPCTMLIKTEAYKNVNGYDERLKANEDTELAIKLCKRYKLYLQDDTLVRVTRNHESLMGNSENYAQARELIIEKHKDFLSKNITFRLANKTADYYLLINKMANAKRLLRKAIKIKPYMWKTIFTLLLAYISPKFLASRKKLKYGSVPNISQ